MRRSRKGLPRTQRRLYQHTLLSLEQNDRVYDYQLNASDISTLLRAELLVRVEKGVLQLTQKVKEVK